MGGPRVDVAEISQPSGDDVTATSSVPIGRPCISTENFVGTIGAGFCAPSDGANSVNASPKRRLLRWRKGCGMSRITDEYRTVAGRVGWLERRSRGRLSFTGRDAASFLHALVTNEMNALGSGCGAYAAYLTPQGRMITDLTIHRREHDLLVDTGTSDAAELAARFDQLLFSEDVQVADVTATTAHLTVIGAPAAAVLGRAFIVVPVSPDVLSTLPMLSHALAGDAIVVRTDEVALPSFDVFLPASALPTAVVRLGEL